MKTAVTLAAVLLLGYALPSSWAQLFVTDQAENEIEKFNTPGVGTVFVPNPNSGFGVPQPTGITFGPDGDLYVVGTGSGVVSRYDINGAAAPGPGILVPPMSPPNATFTTGPNGLSGAQGITFGTDGNIYVTNQQNISQYNGITGAFIQNFTPANPNSNLSNVSFTGIAVGPDGAIYAADGNGSPFDPYHDSVLRLDVTNILNPFTTFVSSSHAVNGDASHPLSGPTGITFGSDGNLYIASGENAAIGGRVLRFSGMSNMLDTFVPNGSAGLNLATGLVFGPDGNLYVSSFFHQPPAGMDPGTESFVGRYNGSTGAFIDYFGQASSTSDAFFGVAFPTLAAVPEANTVAIGVLLSLFLGLQSYRGRRPFSRYSRHR